MMLRATLVLLLLAAAVPGRAAEDVQSHSAAPTKLVRIGTTVIIPQDVQMSTTEVLEFLNPSFAPLTVRFIEPKDMQDKVRCQFLDGSAKAPWLLFSWDWEKRLVATVPPGRLASICSFSPGFYSYTVSQTFREEAGGPSGTLPLKGTITVK